MLVWCRRWWQLDDGAGNYWDGGAWVTDPATVLPAALVGTAWSVDLDGFVDGTYTATAWSFDAAGNTDATAPAVSFTLDTSGPGPASLVYVSLSSSTTVPDVGAVDDLDIVVYDLVGGTWAMYFDASDVGLTSSDVNAFHVRDDGSILLSFSGGVSVPGLTGGPSGTTVDDSDVVLFTPTSTGEVTAGSFSFFLDGSDIGLDVSAEDIHGLYEFADGTLAITTNGSLNVPGLATGRDEDVTLFVPVLTGSITTGTWTTVHVDGSDVGLTSSGDDLDAISFDAGDDLLYSTRGDNSVPGSADEDINRFTGSFGPTTTGTATLELDLSTLGIESGNDVDGLHFGGQPVDPPDPPPVTSIDEPADGAVLASLPVSVSGMATDNVGVVSTVVQLDDGAGNYWDGGAWVTDPGTVLPAVLVGSDWSIDLSGFVDGVYTVTAWSTDAEGGSDETPPTVSFTFDTTDPVTSIDAPSDASTVVALPVSVSGMAMDNVGVVSTVVQLDDGAGNYWDGGAWVTDPATVLPAALVGTAWSVDLDGFVDGTYTATAWSFDAAGNTDATAPAVSFTLDTTDTTDPVTTIDAPSDASTVVALPVSVSGMAMDNVGVVSTVVQLDDGAGNYWDGGAWVTDPATVLPAALVGTAWSVDLDGFVDGTYTATAWSFDAAGNTDATAPAVSFTLDTSGPGPASLVYVSLSSSTTVPDVGAVDDLDIVVYDLVGGTWAMYFDASDVGLTSSDVNAFHVRDDGSILLSFSGGVSVPGLTGGPSGTTVDDSDVVLFTPTSTGEVTAGSFSFFLDGSDIGLDVSAEDIHGLYEFADGTLAITTNGSLNVPGLATGRDEDVTLFVPVLTGSITTGTWTTVHVDGSDVGLTSSGDDLDAISFDAGDDLLYSTRGDNSVPGSADEDINRFTGSFGPTTTGTATLELDLSTLGIESGNDVDGLHFSG